MGNKDFRYVKAQQKAEQFLKENGFHDIPVNLEQIASHLDIQLLEKSSGTSGMLLIQGNDVAICYATHIDNNGFQRFSIAHEIGHMILDGHIEHILPDGDGKHISQAGFTSRDPYEIEADNFAAALLMPKESFKKEMRKSGEGLEAIKKLSVLFETSLTSTAIRYIEFSKEYCAIIVSKGSTIDYAFMSKPLEQLPDIEWIKKQSSIPTNTLTKFFNESTAEEDSAGGNLGDWFNEYSLETKEEVIGLGHYGKTLTVITVTQDIDEYELNKDLEESSQIKFKR